MTWHQNTCVNWCPLETYPDDSGHPVKYYYRCLCLGSSHMVIVQSVKQYKHKYISFLFITDVIGICDSPCSTQTLNTPSHYFKKRHTVYISKIDVSIQLV